MTVSAISGNTYEDDDQNELSFQVGDLNGKEVIQHEANEDTQAMFQNAVNVPQDLSNVLCMEKVRVSTKADVQRDKDGNWTGSGSIDCTGESADGSAKATGNIEVDSDGNVKGSVRITKEYL